MKKFIALLLAAVMVFCLAACGGSSLSKYEGVYKNNALGLDLGIILDKNGNYGIDISQIFEEDNDNKPSDYGLSDNLGVIMGSYKVGDEGKLYFTMNKMDENTDLALGLIQLLIQGLFTSPATYDSKAEAILINEGGQELAFMKSDEKMPKLYTGEEIMKATTQKETKEEEPSQEPAREPENEPVKEPEKEPEVTGPKLPAGVDEFMYEVDNYLGNAIDNGWAENWNYIKKVADDGTNYYWHWSAGGGHGIVVQSMKDPKKFVDDFSDTLGSVSSLVYALSEANGQYFSFKSIKYAYDTQIAYGDELYDGEVWAYTDNSGKSTEYTYSIILPDWAADMTDDPEELEWYKEITVFKDGMPWVGFDSMEGFPYKY